MQSTPSVPSQTQYEKMKRFLFAAGMLIFIWTQPVQGFQALDPMFQEAAQTWGVPVAVTKAIATVESGLSPWALNIEGESRRSGSKEEALSKAREAMATGRSFDVGVMQVNNFWLKKYGIPLEAAFDPLANIHLGSWILKKEIEMYGDTWNGVAAYHSPNWERGRKYAEMVKTALAKGPLNEKNKRLALTAQSPVTKPSVDSSPLVIAQRGEHRKQTIDKGLATASPFVQRLNFEGKESK